MYKPINGWTKRKIVNHIKKNFKGKSKDSFMCMYRDSDGRKCAVGLFIPDDMYDESMEGHTFATLTRTTDIEEYMPLENTAMWDFQLIHDHSKENETLEKMLEWVKTNVESKRQVK